MLRFFLNPIPFLKYAVSATVYVVSKFKPSDDVNFAWDLQDAYALCRVFKKSLNAPKSGDHYASDRSSSIDVYTEESRFDDIDHTSPNYGMPMNVAATTHDDKWMQYLSDEAFTSINPNSNGYHPSKVIYTNR